MNREELGYHLDSYDETYGEAYAANPDSRWNTPEIVAFATDVGRKVAVLQTRKAFTEKWDRIFNTT